MRSPGASSATAWTCRAVLAATVWTAAALPAGADSVVVKKQGATIRVEGLLGPPVGSGKVQIQAPGVDRMLIFEPGDWLPESLEFGSPCENARIRQAFFDDAVARGRYVEAVRWARDLQDQGDAAQSGAGRCVTRQPSGTWGQLRTPLIYLGLKEPLDRAVRQVDIRFRAEFGRASADARGIQDLREQTERLDRLFAGVAEILAKGEGQPAEVRAALALDALDAFVRVGDLLERASEATRTEIDEWLYDEWRMRCAPDFAKVSRLQHLRYRARGESALGALQRFWANGAGANDDRTPALAVSAETARLRQDADRLARAFSAERDGRLSHAELAWLVDLQEADRIAGDPPLGELPDDLEQYRQSGDYCSLIGLALQMYNAGPGRALHYGGRVPYASTVRYVRTILERLRLDEQLPGEFDALIQDQLDRLGQVKETILDMRLVKALIATESNFDSRAIGADGEKGLMQIMPPTWNEIFWNDRAPGCPFDSMGFDPMCNLRVGIVYLNESLQRARGDLSHACS